MNHVLGVDRNQTGILSLEMLITQENTVRLIDVFVDKLDLEAMQFITKKVKQEGRPSFEGKLYLKLY